MTEMIRGDLTQPAQVDSEALPWVPSPLAGVERRMLDRIGGEVARATSIVRYAPASKFSPHRHDGGEEFLVLDGVFSDESGDFGPGTYVRNPPGTSHEPHSEKGCTIFVKLHQMWPEDEQRIVVDTTAVELQPTGNPDVAQATLYRSEYDDEHAAIETLAAAGTSRVEAIPGGAEILVLEGDLINGEMRFGPGGWLRFPDGAGWELASASGCRYWVKRGHLRDSAIIRKWTKPNGGDAQPFE